MRRLEPGLLELALAAPAGAGSGLCPATATLESIDGDGTLWVLADGIGRVGCDVLDTGGMPPGPFACGDRLLALLPGDGIGHGVVLGRVGRYGANRAPARLRIEATESLTLQCGEASVELRADGRAMVKGEDVLLRAKGTQRIRAGNVAIN